MAMQNCKQSINSMIRSPLDHRELLWGLIKRDIIGRYRGSAFGMLWSFIYPVFMLAVYTFVFSIVFNARWHTDSGSKAEFALILYAGLLIFNLFAECISRAPMLVVSNVNYVKKVVFPLEILPWVSLGAALFHFLVSLVVWLLFYSALFGLPHITTLLMPFMALPLIFLTLGVSWLLASLGVYLRDIGQMVGILTTVLMFLSPIFYPVSAIPERYQAFIYLNPLTLNIEQARALLVSGQIPSLAIFGVQLVISVLIAWLGYAWFQKTRKGFADVL